MGVLGNIKYWFLNMFGKIKALIAKLWEAAKPFIKEVLSQAAQQAWESLQELLIEAAQYVATQGLPTDEAKRIAFKEYMLSKAKKEVEQLKDSELNMLREMAVAIVKKINA